MVKDSEGVQELDENGELKDCHNIVKSSGLNGAKRRHLCCDAHRKKLSRVSVACQTENSGFFADDPDANCSKISTVVGSPKKNDGSKPEGTLRLMIKNFRNMTDTVRGPGQAINSVPWKIMVMPRQHVMQKKGTQKCLGFFLQCCPDAYSDSWSCQAAAELRLISQKSGVPNFTRKTNHVYTAKENDWGYSCFMTWADILDENQGYIKDDKVILEVFVKADPAKNVLTHDAFCKKIQDYMRLADLQSSRGLTDKAIEVNLSALKFCKDKDEKCKEELDTQKQKLIEMKLKQSIERIEKGKQPGIEGEEDASANLNVLRQALTGNLTNLKRSQSTGQPSKPGEKPKKQSTPPTSKDDKDMTKSEEQLEKELKKLPSGIEVQEIVDDLVNQLSDDDEGASGYGSSADSEDLCDSCLQEQLETIISKEDIITSESGCQTEPLLVPRSPSSSPPRAPMAQTRLSPVGSSQPADENSADGSTTSPQRRMSDDVIVRSAADGSEVEKKHQWTAEKEAELLDLITQESKASLDSIKDTLERLVAFQVTLQDSEELPAGLELDLAQLRQADYRLRQAGEPSMDVIEIPTVDLPDTDVVDLGSNDGTNDSSNDQPPPPPPKIGLPLVKREEEASGADCEQMSFQYSQDEYTLIRHAKEIVETKAEELVNKYSQLIEQSEATRLAETVKKVEKRMKDIEKQTMTCRKELADECERHFKEEQKLIKTNKTVRTQLDQANDKIEKLNNQLKDRKAEIKKLEKRLKAETQISAENAELMSRIEQLEKELGTAQKKQTDDTKRHQKETQSLQDSKKQLQQELTSAAGDIERLNSQVEEKVGALKKLEHRFEQDRKQANISLKEALERAKKAETNLLEFKLEMGLKMLQRAQEDCLNNIKHLDLETKRYVANQRYEEGKQLQNYMNEWQKTREKIGELMSTSKNDFSHQIEAVRNGKQLASLPVLEVPKPPPPPKIVPFHPSAENNAAHFQHHYQDQKPLAPIGARPMQPQQQQQQPQQSIQSPVAVATHPHHTPITNGPNVSEAPPNLTPIVLPNQYHQQTRNDVTPPGNGVGPQMNGFSPWSDPLNLVGQMSHTSQMRPFGGHMPATSTWSDGWGTLTGPVHGYGSGPPLTPGSAPPQQTTAGQWGVGWGYQQVTQAPAPSPPVADKQMNIMRPVSRGPAASPGTQALVDSRGSSPITTQTERGAKKLEALLEQLRATFPTVPPDQLREFVYQFKNQRPSKSLKGMSVEDAVKGVVQVIMSKNKQPDWSQSSGVSMAMDTFGANVPRSQSEMCEACRQPLRTQQVTALKCKHRFHTKCVQEWLSSQQSCPQCGKFNPSPEEFPDLS